MSASVVCLVDVCYCYCLCCMFFFPSRWRHPSCALVTGVQTCALPMLRALDVVDAHREVARLRGLPPEKIAPRAREPVIEPVRITPPPPTSSAAEVVHAAPAEPATAAKPAEIGRAHV